jgi:predicted nucleic acid-binding Zn finger protein
MVCKHFYTFVCIPQFASRFKPMARFDLNETTEKDLLAYFRVSTRLDRAADLVDFVVEESQGLFLVQSASKPKQYIVDLERRTCDCPDWTFRGAVNGIPCKHIMAAYLAAHRKPRVDQE